MSANPPSAVADHLSREEPRDRPTPDGLTDFFPVNGEIPAWRETALRLDRLQTRIRRVFPAVVNITALIAMVAAGLIGLCAVMRLAPDFSMVWSGVAMLPMAALAGLAAGHASGQWLLRCLTGLGPTRRKAFMLRLGADRAPSRWPIWFQRWLGGGDWLLDPRTSPAQPYYRAFVTGNPVADLDEIAWWGIILQQMHGRTASARAAWEPGACHFELGYVHTLPRWTLGLTDGATLAQVMNRTGPSTTAWATHFWNRARRQATGLGLSDQMESGAFCFWRISLGNGRDALVVSLSPAADRIGDALPEVREDAA